MRRAVSLYTRLMVAVATVTAVGVLSLVFWNSHSETKRLRQMLRSDALVLCANLAETLAHQLVVEDYAGAEAFVLRSMRLPNMLKFQLCDPAGRLLVNVQQGADGKIRVSNDQQRLVPPVGLSPQSSFYNDRGVIWQPIAAGSLLGWLRIEFSLTQVIQMRTAIWQQGLLLGVGLVLGICLLLMALIRPPAVGIRQLAAFARRLPSHKGETIDVYHGIAELEDLGSALNYASAELARIDQELMELNRTLQNRVDEEVAKSREKDVLLLQQARYQTLGDLLVNIAHHWRQPLNAVGAMIQEQAWQIVNNELAPGEAITRSDEIMGLLQQLSHSLEGFRQLCQPASSSADFLASGAVSEAISIVREGFRLQGVELRLELAAERPVHGPRQDLIQVVLNLLNNARDALLANQVANGQVVVRIALSGSETLLITVADNGGGIPPEVQTTLFDPYVTTKFRSQGVGLGLFVVRQLVEQRFCGIVGVANSEGGAVFTLAIPVSSGGFHDAG
jgi:signal transduction histidine kinase